MALALPMVGTPTNRSFRNYPTQNFVMIQSRLLVLLLVAQEFGIFRVHGVRA